MIRRRALLAAPALLLGRSAEAMIAFPSSLFGGTCGVDPAANVLSACHRSAYIALSTDKLSASTAVIVSATGSGVGGVIGRSTGKRYIEYTLPSTGSATPLQFGLCTAAATFLLATGTDDAAFIQNNGALMDVRCKSTSYGLAGSFCGLALSGVIGVAVDLDARLIWIKSYDSSGAAVGKQWNVALNGDPAAGTGGVDLSVLSSATLYPFMGMRAGIGGGAVGPMGTFNPTSSVVHAAPSGFTAGW